MPSFIRPDKKAKTRGMERVMMRDAMRAYAKANGLTMAEVRAHPPAAKRTKPKSKRKVKK